MATLGEQAIGSIVKLNVGGVATNFIVVHHGLPDTTYDPSCDGTWLLMEDIYEERPYDSTDTQYAESDIHDYLSSTFYGLFDEDIKTEIKQAKIPYLKSYGSSSSIQNGAKGLSATIFLLTYVEVGFTGGTADYDPTIGAVLDYFSDIVGNTNSTNAKRIATFDGAAEKWWTRGPRLRTSNNVYIITESGGLNGWSMKSHQGVRPAMILNPDLTVESDGTVSLKSSAITGSVLIDGVHRILTGIGYINIGGVLRELADSQVNINSVLKSVANAEYRPGGYTEVEYIESTGTQYIDTGFKPNQNTRVVVDAYVTAQTAIQALFGARNAAGSNAFDVFALGSSDGGGYQTDYAAESTVKNDILCSGRHTVDKNKNSFAVDGTLLHTHTASTFSCSYNLYLFTNNNGGTTMTGTFPTAAKLYSCKIYDNGTLVRDFIPCKNEVGEVGLYDLVNDKFYGNSGSGSFTAGANVT